MSKISNIRAKYRGLAQFMRKGLNIVDQDKNRLDYSRAEVMGVDPLEEYSKKSKKEHEQDLKCEVKEKRNGLRQNIRHYSPNKLAGFLGEKYGIDRCFPQYNDKGHQDSNGGLVSSDERFTEIVDQCKSQVEIKMKRARSNGTTNIMLEEDKKPERGIHLGHMSVLNITDKIDDTLKLKTINDKIAAVTVFIRDRITRLT